MAVDNFGVEILPTDTLRIIAWGGGVRLLDVGRTGTLLRVKRTGNLALHVGGEEITAMPCQVAVARRDGLSGHQGNVGTAHDSHARAAARAAKAGA